MWADDSHPVTVAVGIQSPNVTGGQSIRVAFGSNGYGAFGLQNMVNYNNIKYMYANEYTGIEFDIYFDVNAKGVENLKFILQDSGYSTQPMLKSFIPGWLDNRPMKCNGKWKHVKIDLTKVNASISRFSRFLFWNSAGNSQPNFYMTNVSMWWKNDTRPPKLLSISVKPDLTFQQLNFQFTSDRAVVYAIKTGLFNSSLISVVQSNMGNYLFSNSLTVSGFSRGSTYKYEIFIWAYHNYFPNVIVIGAANSLPGYLLPIVTTFRGIYASPNVPTTLPILTSFTATSNNITRSANTHLLWVAFEYDSLIIDHGVGSVALLEGTIGVSITPQNTTRYSITATNTFGSVTKHITIRVNFEPTIFSFTANPCRISLSVETISLTWSVSGLVDNITIDHNVGIVFNSFNSQAALGSIIVNPRTTATYTLEAKNAFGVVRRSVTVAFISADTNKPWVMGYYAGYRSVLQPPDKVNYTTMTHIMIGAVIPQLDGSLDTNFYISATGGLTWAQDVVNRAHLAGTKAILMVGGAGQTAINGYRATSNITIRSRLVKNLASFVKTLGIDGIDIDWEPFDVAADRPILIKLVEALQNTNALPRSSYLYTIPVGFNNANFNDMRNNDYGTVSTYFDRLNVMSYGMLWFGSGWYSWHSSALYGQTPSTPTSINNTVAALIAAGVPRIKLGIGIGFYGTAVENGYWSGGVFIHQSPPAIAQYVTAPRQSTVTAVSRFDNLGFADIMQYLYSDSVYHWDDIAKAPLFKLSSHQAIFFSR